MSPEEKWVGGNIGKATQNHTAKSALIKILQKEKPSYQKTHKWRLKSWLDDSTQTLEGV